MKKRRTLIISLLLVAALALGVGYAAVSVSDEIFGTVKMAANEDFTVDFTEVKVNGAATGTALAVGQPVTGDWGKIALGSTANQINMDLTTCEGFENAGDYFTADFTIKNSSTESRYKAELYKDGLELTDYAITKADNSAADETAGKYIRVTVTLKQATTTIWQDTSHGAATAAEDLLLDVDGTATLTVKVELLRSPTEALDIRGIDITVPFTAVNAIS